MGSVFSYSDIATPHVDDYQYKLVATEKCPNDSSQSCTKIECTPSNDDVRERTGYSRSLVWVRSDNFMIEKAEYFQLEGKLLKKLDASEIKIVDSKNRKWLAHRLKIVNQLNQDSTELVFSNVKVNSGIPDSVFTPQNLQKVK